MEQLQEIFIDAILGEVGIWYDGEDFYFVDPKKYPLAIPHTWQEAEEFAGCELSWHNVQIVK